MHPTERSSTTDIKVPFADVDSMRIAWHGHYVKYLELARCDLLDSFGYGYQAMFDSGYGWPVIDLQLRYVAPCRFDQIIRVKATLVEWEHRLKIKYLITDAESGQRITKAHTCQVAVHMESGEMSLMSPQILFDKLGVDMP